VHLLFRWSGNGLADTQVGGGYTMPSPWTPRVAGSAPRRLARVLAAATEPGRGWQQPLPQAAALLEAPGIEHERDVIAHPLADLRIEHGEEQVVLALHVRVAGICLSGPPFGSSSRQRSAAGIDKCRACARLEVHR
jgi:hypothetical protein